MSKVFRIYKDGAATLQGWQATPSYPYNSTARDTIVDPDGSSAKHEITSIPSPLARIDLVKTAFAEVVKIGLNGSTIYHKMVSDTLDVAEIFYNRDKIGSKIEIIKWTPAGMQERLSASPSEGHRYLADAMQKFLKADATTYNFDRLQGIYLINYPSGPDELNIIGATSPATLFFSNANELSFVNDIYLGQRRPFNRHEFTPLHRRDREMILYMMALRVSIPGFAGLFPEIDSYLTHTYRAVEDEELKAEIRSLTAADVSARYAPIEVVEDGGSDVVEVIGFEIFKKRGGTALNKSEMTIATTRPVEQPPMVLPIENGNRYSSLQYASAPWGTANAAPISEPEQDLEKRLLPFDGARYPWLTVSDLLEPTLISVPHTLNSADFFDGNIGKMRQEELAYLLPIKPMFFRYFTINDIINPAPGQTSLIEMEQLAGDAVKVTLRVPIRGNSRINHIEYSRIYYPGRRADILKNEGNIISHPFAGVLMPPVKTPVGIESIYNVTCIDAARGTTSLRFYNADDVVNPASVSCRDHSGEHNIKAVNYLLENVEFEYIGVATDSNNGVQGLLVPRWRTVTASRRIDFAVDLGTSNTHIETRHDSSPVSTPLGYEEASAPAAMFFTPSVDETGAMLDLHDEISLIEKDILPASIGRGDFHFPTRTVLSAAKNMRWQTGAAPMTLFNLPFTYDKRRSLPYNAFHTNIKWGTGEVLDIMEAYVNTMMLIMRNKALVDGGDLRQTRLTWFYPASMPPKRLRRLRRVWDDSYRRYFNPTGSTISMSESQAPAGYFYRSVATATSMVNIDIGGGTTDIAYSADGRVKVFTSFRMGANTLFENTLSDIDTSNAIIDRHKTAILNLLKQMNLTELVHIFNSPANQQPANMASFLFTLRDNTIASRAGVKSSALDFNFRLQEDEDFKILFIIFYAAIVYHIGKLISVSGLDLPRHISFSGNGSRILNVITTDVDQLTRLTRLMLEVSSGLSYGERRLEILGLEEGSSPKESTCKGGIVASDNAAEDDISERIVLTGDNSRAISESDTYESLGSETRAATIVEVNRFFDFIDDINEKMDFDDNFGVNKRSLNIARKICRLDLETFLDKGLKATQVDSEPSAIVAETPFFYPIRGAINAISAEIGNSISK